MNRNDDIYAGEEEVYISARCHPLTATAERIRQEDGILSFRSNGFITAAEKIYTVNDITRACKPIPLPSTSHVYATHVR